YCRISCRRTTRVDPQLEGGSGELGRCLIFGISLEGRHSIGAEGGVENILPCLIGVLGREIEGYRCSRACGEGAEKRALQLLVADSERDSTKQDQPGDQRNRNPAAHNALIALIGARTLNQFPSEDHDEPRSQDYAGGDRHDKNRLTPCQGGRW